MELLSTSLNMPSGEMFKGDFPDTRGDKFPLAFIGDERMCQACEDKGRSRTPIGMIVNYYNFFHQHLYSSPSCGINKGLSYR
jgi:hypothetical protein